MTELQLPRILTPKKTYTFDYDAPLKFERDQQKHFWTAHEVKVEKCLQDLKVRCTPAERHAIITALKLFTHYELFVGEEWWIGRIAKWFKRPEIVRMAVLFGSFELNVHAPFYNKINELLYLNTDEFYDSYVDDPVLNDRMNYIERYLLQTNTIVDKLRSLAVFSFIEGGILYSSFAFFKHFQVNGKNLMKEIVAGINFSIRDEHLHSLAGAWLFRTLLAESLELGLISEEELESLYEDIRHAARLGFEHECRIIDMFFEKGDIAGLRKEDKVEFVASRFNLCLRNINIDPIFEVGENPVAEWFYGNLKLPQINDFFNTQGNQYNREWSEESFVFVTDF